MSFLKQLNKNDVDKKQKKILDKELPFFITIVTLLASSGFGPYTIFQKMQDIKLLPTIRLESIKILKRVDILGIDPLTAILETKNKIASRALGDFLGGYVSSIQSGGNVVNYLKSKMTTIFEQYGDIEKESVEKVKALIESYMTLQIVILAVYIIVTATTTTSGSTTGSDDFDMIYLVVLFPPLVSGMFMVVAKKMDSSHNHELDLKKIIMFGVPSIGIALIMILLNFIPDYNGLILGFGLIAASIWPATKYINLGTFSIDSQDATPSILRDIAESRKAGLAPERCVIKACKRDDFKSFNPVSKSIANKLEWGISLKSIYESLEKDVKNFKVLINFKILFEVISSGGGNVHTLDSLAGISEKIHNIEKIKREMLQPYVMIGFMLLGITSFVTLMVIDSLTEISIISENDEKKKLALEKQFKERFTLLSMSILVQAFLAGLFLGKIITGTYSGGFRYSAILLAISMVSIVIMQSGLFDIQTLLGV